jgi:hypothetical protein
MEKIPKPNTPTTHFYFNGYLPLRWFIAKNERSDDKTKQRNEKFFCELLPQFPYRWMIAILD